MDDHAFPDRLAKTLLRGIGFSRVASLAGPGTGCCDERDSATGEVGGDFQPRILRFFGSVAQHAPQNADYPFSDPCGWRPARPALPRRGMRLLHHHRPVLGILHHRPRHPVPPPIRQQGRKPRVHNPHQRLRRPQIYSNHISTHSLLPSPPHRLRHAPRSPLPFPS
jgi:hypothetical protein